MGLYIIQPCFDAGERVSVILFSPQLWLIHSRQSSPSGTIAHPNQQPHVPDLTPHLTARPLGPSMVRWQMSEPHRSRRFSNGPTTRRYRRKNRPKGRSAHETVFSPQDPWQVSPGTPSPPLAVCLTVWHTCGASICSPSRTGCKHHESER